MLPFGYFTSDASRRDFGTLGPGPGTMSYMARTDPLPKAPTVDCLQNCLANFSETKSMLHLQMNGLQEKIQIDVSRVNPKRGKGLPESVVTMIFTICNMLKVSDTCKYKACEIHDSFMVRMNDDIRNVVNRTQLGAAKVAQIELRVQELAMLRIATCIQLATKIYAYGVVHRHVTVRELRTILNIFHCRVTEEVIRQSELRAMALLNHNLNLVTGLDVMELVLIQIGLSQVDYRRIYTVAIYFLDHLYLKRQEIFNEMHAIASTQNPLIRFDRQKFGATVEANKFIEGSAIIIAAFEFLKLGAHPSYRVLEQLVYHNVDLHLALTLSLCLLQSSRRNAGLDVMVLGPGLINPNVGTTPTPNPKFYISSSTSTSRST